MRVDTRMKNNTAKAIQEPGLAARMLQNVGRAKQAFDAIHMEMGRLVAKSIMLMERQKRSGPDSHPEDPEIRKWARQPGSVYMGDQKAPLEQPRLRGSNGEIPLDTYQKLRKPGAYAEERLGHVFRDVLSGSRGREIVTNSTAELGVSPRAISKHLVKTMDIKLQELKELNQSLFYFQKGARMIGDRILKTAIFVFLVCAGLHMAFAETEDFKKLPEGMRLPLRYGIGFTFYTQSQNYIIDSLDVGIPIFNPAMADLIKVKNDTTTEHISVDCWLLPFLDVEALVGRVHGTTKVKISELRLPIPLSDLTIKYDGLVYGTGLTLAGGHDRYFGSFTTQYTGTDLNLNESSVTAIVLTPKAGVTFSRAAIWAGAMYQRAKEDHRGRYTIPFFGNVSYSVKLHEKSPWNFQAGFTSELAKHWLIVAEGGLGDRKSLLARIEYRL